MRKTILDNKTLDTIGKKLVESGVTRSSDIERIISKPYLFAAVRERIAVNETQSLLAPAGSLAMLFIKRNAASFAGGVLILVVGAVAVSFFRSENTLVAVTKVKVPDAIPEVARPVFPPQGIDSKLSAGRAFDPEIQPIKSVANVSAKRPGQRQQTNAIHEPAGEFYAISASYGADDDAAGSRIIRVDVPRSSLFALGVNIPLENDAEVVKADLLIGSDGVTRGIRVVK